MEENVQNFIDKKEIVKRWILKVTDSEAAPISDDAIVILLDTLGLI